MAEQDPDHHHTTECKDESSAELKQWKTDISPNEEQQLSVDSASSSASTNRETNDNGEDVEQSDVKNGDSAEKRTGPLPERSSPSDEDAARKVKENSTSLDEGSHGDYKSKTPGNEPSTTPAEEISNSASSSASTNRETNDNGEDVEQSDVKNGDSAEKRTGPLPERSSPSDEDAARKVKENSTSLDEGSHGDYRSKTPGNEPSTTPAEEISNSASSSASTNRETNDNGEDVEQSGVKNGDSAEKRTGPLPERSSPSDEDAARKVKENSTSLDEGSHGDYRSKTPGNEPSTTPAEEISRENYTGEKKKAPETTSPPALGVRNDDQVDLHNEESPDPNNTEAGKDDGSSPKTDLTPEEEKDIQDNTSPQRKEKVDVPTAQESAHAQHALPEVIGNQAGSIMCLIGILVVVVALLVPHLQPESPPQEEDVRQIDIFLRQLEKVKTQFPNQRAELWNRSKIHLLRHLQSAQPTEPVSLILTAGHKAETTLRCLAQGLASAFSSALNASVLHIDGASKASQDSDQVKLDIDSKLQGAFEGDKPVAVIERFEELPPGSTLIFYRYCDHENAAYKKTCLIFTVLLGDEEEIPAETRLSTVEEMVDDHLQKKFLSDGHPVSFDRMDLDKYGGLWSRISHLILPVAAEERIEHEGC
ncbi:torsin-1A-interacting protein 2-like isoform X3 [Perca fluviatilis]|uniref:torsin-1A-interacting protein 2-like isoform X3 n=1 Tax=Perca fluviatilis TaxID=8168 RepID=UPI001964E66D|nr:torsin-1A-interacting protein 2-like isoform X3 [Perca fluviatilis]